MRNQVSVKPLRKRRQNAVEKKWKLSGLTPEVFYAFL